MAKNDLGKFIQERVVYRQPYHRAFFPYDVPQTDYTKTISIFEKFCEATDRKRVCRIFFLESFVLSMICGTAAVVAVGIYPYSHFCF